MFDHTDNSLSAFITTSASRPLSPHPPWSLLTFIQCVSSKHYCWNVHLHWSHLSIKCGSRVHLLRKLNLRHSLVHPLDSCVISLWWSYHLRSIFLPHQKYKVHLLQLIRIGDPDPVSFHPSLEIFFGPHPPTVWVASTSIIQLFWWIYIFHYPFSHPILECDSDIIL